MSDGAVVLEARGLCKRYRDGSQVIDVIQNVDFKLGAGERLAVVGRSGSGKSTLLHLLAGLDTPDEGEVLVGGVDLARASNNRRAEVRCAHMGFVYQNHHLLPEFTALENVAIPLRIAGVSRAAAFQQAEELLADVGLAQRVTHLPSALSGGERQRVAVARAIAGEPDVVLADEPTGNLDSENAEQVIRLLVTLSEKHGTAYVVVTHDRSMLGAFNRVMTLAEGTLREGV